MDTHFMKIALDLAKKGEGQVSPNPLVGAVIVKDTKIIGKGYHSEFGKNHAEINAILDTHESLLGATMYVTLEPCTVFKKTPPCVDRIIKEGFKRVVIAQKDPNQTVNGKGIKKLKNAGIDVDVGILEEEACKLNTFYNYNMKTKKPFISIKAAMTFDGKIADMRGESKWITSEDSRNLGMYLRFIHDAILVGAETIRHDNPHLDIRGYEKKRPYYKIIISKKLNIPEKLNVFETSGETIIFCGRDANQDNIKYLEDRGVVIFQNKASSNIDADFIRNKLFKKEIGSILIEGGASVFANFIEPDAINRMYLFYAPIIFGKGISAFGKITPRYINNPLKLDICECKRIGTDFFVQGEVCSPD